MSDGEVLAWFIFGTFGLICAVGIAWPRKRNKRTGLPAPRRDNRSSIEQFKRMHNT